MVSSTGIPSETVASSSPHRWQGRHSSESPDPIYDLVCVPYFRPNSCPLKVNRDRISVGFHLAVTTRYMAAVNIDGESLDSGFHSASVSGSFGSVANPLPAVSTR